MRCLIMTAIYKSFNVKLKMGQKLTPHADDDVIQYFQTVLKRKVLKQMKNN